MRPPEVPIRAQPAGRQIVRALLATLLLGIVLVRYVVRQYVRKQLIWRRVD
jgi:hypothetical protein